jgi:hypothetical protein
MPSSAAEKTFPRAVAVRVTDREVIVDLVDGRTVLAPISWYPRLRLATRQERRQWRLIDRGAGIHWPDIDEDISVAGLLAGRRSGESAPSFRDWARGRGSRNRSIKAPAARRRGT